MKPLRKLCYTCWLRELKLPLWVILLIAELGYTDSSAGHLLWHPTKWQIDFPSCAAESLDPWLSYGQWPSTKCFSYTAWFSVSLLAFPSLAGLSFLIYFSSVLDPLFLLLSFNYQVLRRIFTVVIGPWIFIISLLLLYLSYPRHHSVNFIDIKHVRKTMLLSQETTLGSQKYIQYCQNCMSNINCFSIINAWNALI